MKKWIFILGCFTATYSYSQSNNSPIDTSLQEVIIRENRLHSTLSSQDRNIRIITKNQINRLPVKSINELLSYVAGVDVRQRGPVGIQADVSIDGGTFDQTLVLLNGIRMTDPQSGHNMMNLPITLDIIDHIEILKGSAARIYGVNALTGAINFVTRQPTKNELLVTGYAGSNFDKDTSNNDTYYNWGGRATGSLVSEKSKHLFSMSHDKGNGIRYNTAFNNTKLYYQGLIKTNANDHVDFSAGYVYNNYGANGFYAAPGDKNSGETINNALTALSYTKKINAQWTMTPRVSYRFAQDDYRYIKNPLTARNLHKTNIINADWNNTIQTNVGDIGFGLEYRTEIIRSSNLGSHNRSNYGAVGEYRFKNLGNFSTTLGGYLNYNNDYGWQFFPGIDVGYKIIKHLKWFANVGTGQRLPTYTDLYYNGPANIANPDVKDEKAKYGETGFKYNSSNVNATASYFYRKINNMIDWVRATTADKYITENFESKMQGFSFALDYTLTNNNSNTFANNIFSISYTNLQPQIVRPTPYNTWLSRYAINSLRNQLVVNASSTIVKNLTVSIAGRYQQRINYIDYILLDMRIKYAVANRINIYVDGTNITNRNYSEVIGSPMPGRWYTLGANVTIF